VDGVVADIETKYRGGNKSKEFWSKVAIALDEDKPFYKLNRTTGKAGSNQPAASILIEPFLKDNKNPNVKPLLSYLSSTNKDSWDDKMIYAIAKGTATFHVGSGQSGSGQKGGFLSALAGVAIPAIISAISGSGQGGASFSPYKPKKQKNRYAYLK